VNQDPGQEPHPDELGTVRVRVQPGSAAIQVATDQLSRPKSMSPATIGWRPGPSSSGASDSRQRLLDVRIRPCFPNGCVRLLGDRNMNLRKQHVTGFAIAALFLATGNLIHA